MASITIRRLDDGVKQRLRIRAAQHGKSMEEEARAILTENLKPEEDHDSELNWVDRLRRPFIAIGGMDIEFEPREPMPEPPTFD